MPSLDAMYDAKLAAEATEKAYYAKKVGTTGKTQAQLDAATNAAETAKLIGGTIDPKTGYVVPKSTPKPVVSVVPVAPVAPVAPVTLVAPSAPLGTDPALLSLIASLQKQISDLGNSNAAAANLAALEKAKEIERNRESATAVLTSRFAQYGLTGLANKIKELAIDGASEATITLQLQETNEYKQRFKANDARIKNNLKVLSPSEYLNVEDGYRQVLRAYGLKQFDNDAYVQQFIGNDMSPTEFSNRVVTAVQRVQNADPAIINQLRSYYGIGNADLVAYVLDPEQQFQKIERQVAASEIGVAAARQGLSAGVSVAEQLAAQGVTEAQAQKGYSTIADILPTAEKLSSIYGSTMDTYNQSTAEQEVFNGLASAQRKRTALSAREIANFSGSSGLSKSALDTQSKGNF
jgi:hypothetical protein